MNKIKGNITTSQKSYWQKPWIWVVFVLCFIKLFIHLWSANRYGFHRDELLYLAQGDHLALGYMEAPPITAWMGRLARFLGGDSLFTLRTLTALTGFSITLLTIQIVRKLKGNLFAQALAVACILSSTALFRNHTLFQPVVFDQFFWLLTYYFLVCYLVDKQTIYLLLLGVAAGLGMLAKYNMLFCGGGIVLALFTTSHRKLLLSKWPWVALGITLLILLPNFIWQYQHDFPVLEHFAALYKKQLKEINPAGFLWAQVSMHQYITTPVWLLGLWYFLRVKPYHWLGWAYLFTLGLFIWGKGQAYYFNGVYPLMFAGGAVCVSQWLVQVKAHFILRPLFIFILLLFGFIYMPYGTPFLPIKSFIQYTQKTGIKTIIALPNGRVKNLTNDYADMFGWQEQVKIIAQLYHQLTPQEQSQCILWGENYGEAGALNHLGKKYGLPPAISVHGSFYLWGTGNPKATLAITIGLSKKDMEQLFEDVTLVTIFKHPYAIDEEHNIPILICRKLKKPLATYWKAWRKYVFS